MMVYELESFAMGSSCHLSFLMLYGLHFSQENLQQWLTDAKARDQFVIRAANDRTGNDTEVFWNDARHLKPDPVYKRAVSGEYISKYFIIWYLLPVPVHIHLHPFTVLYIFFYYSTGQRVLYNGHLWAHIWQQFTGRVQQSGEVLQPSIVSCDTLILRYS
jgi:hypothetical protein